MRARLQGSLRDRAFVRVDRDESGDHCAHPPDDLGDDCRLLRIAHRHVRPRALSTDVDDVRALLLSLHRLPNSLFDIATDAIARERVVREIEDRHHTRPLAERQPPIARA